MEKLSISHDNDALENNEHKLFFSSLHKSEKVRFYLSKRFLMAILIFLGYTCLTISRMNLNLAIIEMTSNDSNNNGTNLDNTKFQWNSKEVGFILSIIFYGNLFSPLGGMLASRIGGSLCFGIGIFVGAILTILTPFILRFNFIIFCISRFILGSFQVLSIVSVPEIWSRWAPLNERSKLTSLSGIGYNFGIMISFPLAGYIAELYSWPYIFYVTGTIPLIWSIIWFPIVRNDPAEDKLISQKEKQYLMKIVNRKLKDKVNYPWKKMFTSKAVWAYLIAKFVTDFGQAMNAISIPQFIKDSAGLSIGIVGLIAAIPQFFSAFGSIPASYLADYIRNTRKTNPTRVHIAYVCTGYIIIGICYNIISSLDFIGSVICISLHGICISFSSVALSVITLDMAPRYASVLTGFSRCFTFIAAFSTPTIVGFIVTDHNASEWRLVFTLFSGLYFIGALIFMIFAEAKLQLWSLPSDERINKLIKY